MSVKNLLYFLNRLFSPNQYLGVGSRRSSSSRYHEVNKKEVSRIGVGCSNSWIREVYIILGIKKIDDTEI